MFTQHSQVIKGLDLVKAIIRSKQESDIFVNASTLVEVVDFLKNYALTHKVEINTAIDEYFKKD